MPEEPRSRGRRRRSKSYYQLVKVQRQLRVLKLVLILLLLVLVGGFVMAKWSIDRLSAQRADLRASVATLEHETEAANKDLKAALQEMDALVEGRMPGLEQLAFETVIAVGKGYVKNVLFNMGEGDEGKRLEYRVVLFNPDLTPAFPEARLMLFDRTGLQVAGVDVVREGSSQDASTRALPRGEVRSYNGLLSIPPDREPVYFLIETN